MALRRPAALTWPSGLAGRALFALILLGFTLSSGVGPLASKARASDLPRVLVLPFTPIYDVLAPGVGEKTAEVLSTELKSSEQLQLVALKQSKVAAPVTRPINPGPARDTAALTEARERSLKADELIKKLKFREAATELEKVIALMEAQHPYVDFNDVVGSYLNIAVAYFRLGLDSEGEKALAQVVRLDPEKKLDAEKYPPVFIRAFDNVSKKVKKFPRGAIEIRPTTAGATVFFDGREVGKAPLLIKDVVKGMHFLRVGEGWSNRIDVPPGDTAKVAPDLGSGGGPVAELMGLLARNTIDELVITRAIALAEQATADFVVLGGVHKEADAIVVSSHLLKVASRKTCLLQRVVFDQEMLGAGIEVYKVGADITNKLEVFGEAERLPAKVARDALAPAGGAKAAVAAVSVGGGGAEPIAAISDPADRLVRRNGDSKPAEKPDLPTVSKTEPKTDVRKLTASSGEPELLPLEPTGPGDELVGPKETSKAWVWVLVGVVVAGGLATGGYFTYDAATKPITGKGTITW